MQVNQFQKRMAGNILFTGVFIGLFFLYNFDETMFYPPQSVHIWRQTNSLSLTHNYYEHNVPFFQPEMHNQFCDQGNSGKAVGEFPVIYYLVAQLWKLFGKHEWIFKLVHVTILFFGLFALFLGLSRIIKNRFLAGFLSLLVFTSPMVVFYGPNFLPDVPALSLIFMAWYFILRFKDSRSLIHLWISAALFCVAMLLKITSALSFVALGGWILFELLFQKKENRIFRFSVKHFIPFLLVIILVFAWYWYADYYNDQHGGHFSYHGIWPVWQMTSDQFHRIIDALDKIYFKELFLPYTQYITVGVWLFMIIIFKKLKPVFRYFIIVLPIGFVIQNLLWFQVLEGHDYYVINLLVVLVAVWTVFLMQVDQLKPLYKSVASVVLFAFLVWNAITCREREFTRYEGWMNEMYNRNFKALIEIQPVFREWGVQKNDKVISIPDFTINGSLYFMNRKGYTDFANDFSKAEAFYNCMDQGAKYLVVNDSTILKNEVIQPFLVDKLGEYKNISVYDLRDVKKPE
jgi:hypothetical protein